MSDFSNGTPGIEDREGGIDGSSSESSGSSGTDATLAETGANDAGSDYRSAVMADSPIGYWRLGEASGLNAKDEVGAHPGGYQGSVTLGIPGVVDDGDTAIALAGTNGSVHVGDVLDFAGNVPITLEAWVWLDVIDDDYRRVIAKRGAEGGYSIFCHPTVKGCSLELLGSGGTSAYCGVTMETGRWYHIVGTYDGLTARGFRDSVEVCNNVASVTLTKVNAALAIGSWGGGGNYLKGKIDEVAIYDKALSPQRVAEHFARRKQ